MGKYRGGWTTSVENADTTVRGVKKHSVMKAKKGKREEVKGGMVMGQMMVVHEVKRKSKRRKDGHQGDLLLNTAVKHWQQEKRALNHLTGVIHSWLNVPNSDYAVWNLDLEQGPKVMLLKDCPWLQQKSQTETTSRSYQGAALSLHDELVAFHRYIQLQPEEVAAREEIVEMIRDILKKRWPSASVATFGSLAASMATFLSDVDMTVDELTLGPLPPPPIVALSGDSDEKDDANTAVRFDEGNAIVDCTSEVVVIDSSEDEDEESETFAGQKRKRSNTEDEESIEAQMDKSRVVAERMEKRQRASTEAGALDGLTFNLSFDAPLLQHAAKELPRYLQEPSLESQRRDLFQLHGALRGVERLAHLEYRRKAKVPIINCRHVNGVEADVRRANPDYESVRYLRSLAATWKAFAPVAMTLKVYLHQLQLDKPFDGGLGSFKLYVLLGRYLTDAQKPSCDYGEALIGFLKRFSTSKGLYHGMTVSLNGITSAFGGNFRDRDVRLAFLRAHHALQACKGEFRNQKGPLSKLSTVIYGPELARVRRTSLAASRKQWPSEQQLTILAEQLVQRLSAESNIPLPAYASLKRAAPEAARRLIHYCLHFPNSSTWSFGRLKPQTLNAEVLERIHKAPARTMKKRLHGMLAQAEGGGRTKKARTRTRAARRDRRRNAAS